MTKPEQLRKLAREIHHYNCDMIILAEKFRNLITVLRGIASELEEEDLTETSEKT